MYSIMVFTNNKLCSRDTDFQLTELTVLSVRSGYLIEDSDSLEDL